ncbi:TPA: DUF2513 domain-containing protein [Vibrio parahaemolyticus]|nr:DUF2513 domain-containing protein [Vibrio parahaemolyticus]EJB8455149.1 DUF2513 domain-containing protein [Vibrio parahaemolyticus]
MRIDLEYMANLLNVFLNDENAHIDIDTFRKKGIQIESTTSEIPDTLDETFLFHLQLAVENKLISNRHMRSDGLKSVGVYLYMSGRVELVDTPIRLTQKGHDFASALENKGVLKSLTTEFKNAPFRVVFDTSQKLLEHVLQKKVDSLLN